MSSGTGMFFTSNGGPQGPYGHLGIAAATAYNPAAPQDEQQDAEREVLATYGRDPLGVLGNDVFGLLTTWAAEQRERAAAGGRPLAKALSYSNPGSPAPKAHDTPALHRVGGAGGAGLYCPKPGLPFSALRLLSRRIEIVQAILRQRQRQMLAFCAPAKLDSEPGWMLGPADQDAELGDDHKEFLNWMQQFLLSGGRRFDPLARRKAKNEDLRTFLGKLASDSLSFDHAFVETVPLRGAMGLDSFWVRDSATFYLASDSAPDGVAYYQDLTMSEQIDFRYEEGALLQRNPQTDLEWCGYSYGELEAGLDTIAMVLSAFAHTRESLDNNAIPRGILVVSGNYDPVTWQTFQASYQQRIRGAANGHGLPVLRSTTKGDISYTQTGAPISEMAFAKWIALQVAILTSMYGLDPTEIGMEAFAASGGSSLGGNDTSERLAASKDKGLRPFLRDISEFISDNIIARFTPTPWARFRFTGLDARDEAAAEQERSRVMTIDEVRNKHGMKPHPQAWIGALPADPGMQGAEFQRLQAVATLGEARSAWGGLDAYPSEVLNSAPMNPSLQAAYNMALQGAAQESDLDSIADPDSLPPEGEGAGDGGPQGPAGGEPPSEGLAGDVHGRLSDLQGGSAPDGDGAGEDA